MLLRVAFKGQLSYVMALADMNPMVQFIPEFFNRVSGGRVTMPVRFDAGCTYELAYTKAEIDAGGVDFSEIYIDAEISETQWDNYYRHHLLALPSSALPFSGISGQPGVGVALNGASTPYVVLHELGHNMGLPHGNLAETVTYAASREYANVYELMGSALMRTAEKTSFMAGFQDGIGWLGPNNKATYPTDAWAAGPGTPAWVADYQLAGVEANNGPDVLETVRIPMPMGTYDPSSTAGSTSTGSRWRRASCGAAR